MALLPWTPRGTRLMPPQQWLLGGHSRVGWLLPRMVGNFRSSIQARAGVGVQGELFLHSMEKKVEGSTN